jgi:AcrR family transcriptional regulator
MAKVKRPYRSEHRTRAARQQVEATKQVILDASRRIFERDGYQRATIKAIASEAGLSEPTVYLHFGSKPAILREVVERDKADTAQVRLDATYAAAPDGVAMITTGFQSLRRHFEVAAPLERVIRDALRAGLDPDVDTGQGDADRRRHAARIVRRLKAEKRLLPGLTAKEAIDVLHLLSTLEVFETLVLQSNWTVAEYERWLTSTVLALLTGQPPTPALKGGSKR